MPVDTVGSFIEQVRPLLESAQAEELKRELPRFGDSRALARHLIQKDWVTPYQANQIFQGKGAGLVLGSYVLLERLGEGGMGQVFKARHRRLERTVALKLIRREHLANQDAVRRFRREIQAVAQLSHPNVVMAYDADQAGETHFFVMEYVDGEPLSQLLKRHGPPTLTVALDYMRQVVLGLQHAHERGMVHRDIKPSNLLVTKPGSGSSPWGATLKILDMGVARLINPLSDDSISALTKEGRVVGTPDYMAPEQAANSAKADIRADLYSVGCTFYQVLAGRVPFPGGTPMEKLLKHRMDTVSPVEQFRPEVPPALSGVLRRLLAKKPEERYQTPAELLAALEQLKSGTAATSRPPMAQRLPSAQVPVPPWHSWFNRAAASKNLPLVIGGISVIVLGLIFMIVALLALKR